MGLGGLTIAATTSAMTDERRLSHGVSHDMAMVVMDPWWNSNLKKYRNHKYVRIVVSKYTYVCVILRYIISQCIYIYIYVYQKHWEHHIYGNINIPTFGW